MYIYIYIYMCVCVCVGLTRSWTLGVNFTLNLTLPPRRWMIIRVKPTDDRRQNFKTKLAHVHEQSEFTYSAYLVAAGHL